jgi:hypothetical protein
LQVKDVIKARAVDIKAMDRSLEIFHLRMSERLNIAGVRRVKGENESKCKSEGLMSKLERAAYYRRSIHYISITIDSSDLVITEAPMAL